MRRNLDRYKHYINSLINSKHRYKNILVTATIFADELNAQRVSYQSVHKYMLLLKHIFNKDLYLLYLYVFLSRVEFNEQFTSLYNEILEIRDDSIFMHALENKKLVNFNISRSGNINTFLNLLIVNRNFSPTLLYYFFLCNSVAFRDAANITFSDARLYAYNLSEYISHFASVEHITVYDSIKKNNSFTIYKQCIRDIVGHMFTYNQFRSSLKQHELSYIERYVYNNCEMVCLYNLKKIDDPVDKTYLVNIGTFNPSIFQTHKLLVYVVATLFIVTVFLAVLYTFI